MATSGISERFCAPDSDITISSSDSVLFKVHRKNLELHSDIFAAAADTTQREHRDNEDIVYLSEGADVLDLLFQYMYRQPQPVLQKMEFGVCARLAEAAEKYLVYSAMPAANLRMRESVVKHPLEVLDYAARHNYTELSDEAARLSMGLSVAQAVKALAPDTLAKWAAFYDHWHARSRAIIAYYGLQLKQLNTSYSAVATCVGNVNPCHNCRTQLEAIPESCYRSALSKVLDGMSRITFADPTKAEFNLNPS